MLYCLLKLRCGEWNVISLYFLCCSVNGSVSRVCLTGFVNCLVKQFAIFLGVVVILLLNVMEVLSVGGGAPLDRLCMVFQRMCLLCLFLLFLLFPVYNTGKFIEQERGEKTLPLS